MATVSSELSKVTWGEAFPPCQLWPGRNPKPDASPIFLCCRSLLRFVSYAAQVTGQFLVYAGSYMLRILGDTEEQPSPKPSTKGWFM